MTGVLRVRVYRQSYSGADMERVHTFVVATRAEVVVVLGRVALRADLVDVCTTRRLRLERWSAGDLVLEPRR